MERTSGYLYQNVYMFIHQSFTENWRDLLYRVQFLSFNIIDCEFWRNGVHGERHLRLPGDDLRGNDMIKARGQCLLDQAFEDADIFGLQNLDREYFWRVTSKKKAVDGERGHRRQDGQDANDRTFVTDTYCHQKTGTNDRSLSTWHIWWDSFSKPSIA